MLRNMLFMFIFYFFCFPIFIPMPMLPCHCFPAMVMAEAAMLTLLNEASTPSWAAKPLWVRSSLSRYPPPLLSVYCQAVAALP